MYRIGIDEVGRGPLAGPVVVAAVALRKGTQLPRELGSLRDSKKMTARARTLWEQWIKDNCVFAIRRSTPQQIDKKNISACANACALRCYSKLREELGEQQHTVRLDGSLFLGSKTQRTMYPKAITQPKADENYQEVALASILAKEYRDRYMRRVAALHPGYGFENHVGYGTKAHYEALKKLGISPIHRLTFLRTLGTIRPIPRT